MSASRQDDLVWCYVTAKDGAEARRIAEAAVAERLAACANLLGPIRSVYRWKGRVERGREVALILKTRRALVKRLAARIGELHSYDCPCVVALPILGGHAPYLDWVRAETAPARHAVSPAGGSRRARSGSRAG